MGDNYDRTPLVIMLVVIALVLSGGAVLVVLKWPGRWEKFFESAPGGPEMAQGARWLAESFAEFGHPHAGQRVDATTFDNTIDGHRTGTASFRINFTESDEPPLYVRCTS